MPSPRPRRCTESSCVCARRAKKLGQRADETIISWFPLRSRQNAAAAEGNGFGTFQWATHEELNSDGTHVLIGKRVQIEGFVIEVLGCLGSGRTGQTLKVRVLEPEHHNGSMMALKFRQGDEGVEKLTRAAHILTKMADEDPVPHAMSMQAFGRLEAPGNSVLGIVDLWPSQSEKGKGLLLALAPGIRLRETSFVDDEDQSSFMQQLREFADAMYMKGLIHGDLSVDNVFWDPELREATVIDFDNAVDVKEQNTQITQRMVVATRKDARHEMKRFLGETFGFKK